MKANLNDLKRMIANQIAEEQGRKPPEPGDCPLCGTQPPFVFRDALSVKEHGITGTCQKCQDSFAP